MSQRADPSAKIQIYILSHDRQVLLREAVSSALRQHAEDVEVIVSDNSEGRDVEEMMRREFPHVSYIRRPPSLSAADHFYAVYRESSSEFVVYFHDDDVLEPEYASILSRELDAHPEAAAVACNAWTLMDKQRVLSRRMGSFHKSRKITLVEELINPYLDFTPILMPPPTPSYMYRRSLIKDLFAMPVAGGKYGDLTTLINVLKRGPIIWIPTPLMWYREHGGNDSKAEVIADRLGLLRDIHAYARIDRKARIFTVYRFRYWLNWWLRGKQGARMTPQRMKVVRRFLVITGIILIFTHSGLWLKIVEKVRRSIMIRLY
jgi:glycosyltransferase involved in cell wall biosynthesis